MSEFDGNSYGSAEGSIAPRRSALLEKLASCAQPDPAQPEWRRSEPRQESAQIIQLELQRRNGKVLQARLLNVTGDALGVVCPKQVRLGEVLVLRLRHHQEPSETFRVVHSTSTIGGFKLGLVLDDD